MTHYNYHIYIFIRKKHNNSKKIINKTSLAAPLPPKKEKKKKKNTHKKKKEKRKKGKRKGLTAVPSLRERSASCPRSAGWACTLGITGG